MRVQVKTVLLGERTKFASTSRKPGTFLRSVRTSSDFSSFYLIFSCIAVDVNLHS